MGQFGNTIVRRDERAELNVFINKIVGDEPHLAKVRDISAGGVYLHKILEPTHLEHGSQIGLEMRLPSSDHVIWVVGQVVRGQDPNAEGVAVRFLRITDHDRRLIQHYVQGQRRERHDSATGAAA